MGKLCKTLRKMSGFNRQHYVYERALISLCYLDDLWIKYFFFIQHQLNDINYLRGLWPKYQHFFSNLNAEIVYFFIDLEEQHSGTADSVKEYYDFMLEKREDLIETHIRSAQFEIRNNNFEKAMDIYKKALNIFASDSSALVYILNLYSTLLLQNGQMDKVWGLYKDYEVIAFTNKGYLLQLATLFRHHRNYFEEKLEDIVRIFEKALSNFNVETHSQDFEVTLNTLIQLVNEGSSNPELRRHVQERKFKFKNLLETDRAYVKFFKEEAENNVDRNAESAEYESIKKNQRVE
eukprot:TRINITY_DN3177_c0_g1_i3.p2 TRINITY_DN3177_c0_g1~~TRINITY_DN3177_c0_g1_i3.p2  ORF type:complete len:292 (-),score=35.02 TRINITY_DN3177_c0_g1_i3:146-1021(-)